MWGGYAEGEVSVCVGVSVTWNVVSWSGGHEFEPWLGQTWGPWNFCLSCTWTKNIVMCAFRVVISSISRVLQTFQASILLTLPKVLQYHNISTTSIVQQQLIPVNLTKQVTSKACKCNVVSPKRPCYTEPTSRTRVGQDSNQQPTKLSYTACMFSVTRHGCDIVLSTINRSYIGLLTCILK